VGDDKQNKGYGKEEAGPQPLAKDDNFVGWRGEQVTANGRDDGLLADDQLSNHGYGWSAVVG
jgi:hypothetical protein